MEIQINYLSILLASIASMVVGFLWYSPSLFGNQWIKLMGHTKQSLENAKSQMGKMYGISFVVSLVTAYVLTHVMTLSENYFHNPPIITGLMTAFWSWLGFIMPVQITDVLFGGKKWNLFAINTGYQLVSLLAMAIVLAMMQ